MLFPGKKLVYFVRHGESANNASNVRQGPGGSLSDKGKEQARFVGERLKNNEIELILASSYVRSRETADIINETLHTSLEHTGLLIERQNPSEIIGKDANSEEVKKIMDVIDKSFHDSNMRYSDEENFDDLKKRAHTLLDVLSQKKEKRILCVSHRIFLKMIFSYIKQGEELDPHEFTVLDFNTKVENTSLTLCEYNSWRKMKGQNPWKILAVNDLGKIV